MPKIQNLLSIKNLSVSFSKREILHSISFEIEKNTIVGVVGESGSGKSVSALSIMGLLPKNTQLSGNITFENHELTQLSQKEYQNIRGNEISMIFQEPMSSLNPALKCGYQVTEILLNHRKISKKQAKEYVLELFSQVKLPQPQRIFDSYPHQISGGQKQRVMITMAMACNPKLLIADEPTTALDVTVQKEIICLIKELQQQTQMSVLFISHDLGLISQIADKIIVMYQGNIVEQGLAKELLSNPQHPYTQALLSTRSGYQKRLKKLPTIADFINKNTHYQIITKEEREKAHQKMYANPPILEIQNLTKIYQTSSWFSSPKNKITAVHNVSFQIYEGETLGLVGESGCGKSTLGRTLLQLEKATKGTIFYQGNDITTFSTDKLRKLRKDLQIIFQDPYASLNPTMRIGEAICEPMKVHNLYKNESQRREKAFELLEQVGLDHSYFDRYPHEFSGGQRQRIGIARAIAVQPKIIVCDESVSALDISVQAQVLNLLNELKEKFKFTYLFISHDLSVVKYMSDRIIVMKNGIIEEIAEADTLYYSPKSPYTQQLIQAIPL